jgi:molybdopterin/thiamine biosynthesis adenylyltransferase
MPHEINLTAEELATYQWQMWVADFGAAGQQRLKDATVLVSRIGGLGGIVAYQLAAAGVGRLILAHAGNVKPSDLNRQLLMTHAWLGKPRVECARRRLLELNPRLEVEILNENISPANAEPLIAQADVTVDCAPRFEERFAMNDASVRLGKPLVECAMYDLEFQLFTVLPGQSACVRCLYPEVPPAWRREFPVFGAVSGAVGCLGAMEAIKLLANFGEPVVDRLLRADLRRMTFQTVQLMRRSDCPACGRAR